MNGAGARALVATLSAAGALVFSMPEGRAWRLEPVPLDARLTAIETFKDDVRVAADRRWYRIVAGEGAVKLALSAVPNRPPVPPGALPDARLAQGSRQIAQAWLADPTSRYRHGVLGDAIEAGSLVIERADRRRDIVRLGSEAVFEDLEPRLIDLDGDGRDDVVVVKSHRDRGSSLAVVGERHGRYTVIAETPPIGRPNAWINPAGIADFDGDGRLDIAVVRQPHAVGRLELWSFRAARFEKLADVEDVSNHVIGSRVLRLSASADFDGDGIADLAIPSFDRRALRLLAFSPSTRELARIDLPARVVMEVATLRDGAGVPLIVLGLDDGKLHVVRR